MHVGMVAIFQNPEQARTDRDVWRDDLRLALMAESLGFESLLGGRAPLHRLHDVPRRAAVPDLPRRRDGAASQLGSMVVVLPWHNPMRVAEQIAVLDHVSNGRFVLGLGRGLGRVEFDGFGVSMDESRERFAESAEMILTGLERGYCEYDGKIHQAGAPRHPPQAVQELQGPQLRRRGLARVGAADREARAWAC